jgi:hypothetical protein
VGHELALGALIVGAIFGWPYGLGFAILLYLAQIALD